MVRSTPAKILADFGNAGQPLMQHLGIEMIEVQEDVVLVLADAATLANLHRHAARLTTSREARSLAEGAWRSMKRSPSELTR